MRILPCNEQHGWERALRELAPPTFLQSWPWGETQRALGEEVVRILGIANGKTVGLAQAATVSARRAQFLHVPHGPVLQPTGHESGVLARDVFSALVNELVAETKRRHLAFLRVSPVLENMPENRALFTDLGFRRAPIHIHAERLWVLDLTPSEEEILAGMRKTTRNLIRRAAREGITVRLSSAHDPLATFLHLYRETATRERFVPFPARALTAEFEAFVASGHGTLAIAEHRGEPLAAALVPFTPWSGFYHHGASSRDRPHLPAAYALQWALIQEAKRRGCRDYNFWGVTPNVGNRTPKHPWAGLTLFKTGFGGRPIDLVPTQDLPLTSRYWLNASIETARRWWRQV